MIKEAIKIGRARFYQVNTVVTNQRLIDLGFSRDDNTFIMGDLKIFLIEGYHYYISTDATYTRINNMYSIAKLIYGKIDYGRQY